jgi:hypothetical protein
VFEERLARSDLQKSRPMGGFFIRLLLLDYVALVDWDAAIRCRAI